MTFFLKGFSQKIGLNDKVHIHFEITFTKKGLQLHLDDIHQPQPPPQNAHFHAFLPNVLL